MQNDMPGRVGAFGYDPFVDKLLLYLRPDDDQVEPGLWSCFGGPVDLSKSPRPSQAPLDTLKGVVQDKLGLEVVDRQLVLLGTFQTDRSDDVMSAQYVVLHHEEGQPLLEARRKWLTFQQALGLINITRQAKTSVDRFYKNTTLDTREQFQRVLEGLGLAK